MVWVVQTAMQATTVLANAAGAATVISPLAHVPLQVLDEATESLAESAFSLTKQLSCELSYCVTQTAWEPVPQADFSRAHSRELALTGESLHTGKRRNEIFSIGQYARHLRLDCSDSFIANCLGLLEASAQHLLQLERSDAVSLATILRRRLPDAPEQAIRRGPVDFYVFKWVDQDSPLILAIKAFIGLNMGELWLTEEWRLIRQRREAVLLADADRDVGFGLYAGLGLWLDHPQYLDLLSEPMAHRSGFITPRKDSLQFNGDSFTLTK